MLNYLCAAHRQPTENTMKRNILTIDPTASFRLPRKIEHFLGEGYTFQDWDLRNSALSEVDVSRIKLISVFSDREDYLSGKDQTRWNTKILANAPQGTLYKHDHVIKHLTEGKDYLNGESVLKRLKRLPCIRLDIRLFCKLWGHKKMIPKDWKKRTGGSTTYIRFPGTIIRKRSGERYCLSLFWRDNLWDFNIRQMSWNFNFNHLMAVLPAA